MEGWIRQEGEPLAEVKANGRVVFNKPAAALIENKPYCMLAYDKENKAIGILPIENKELNAFAIRHTNRGAYVGAKKFLKDTGLLPSANVAQPPIKVRAIHSHTTIEEKGGKSRLFAPKEMPKPPLSNLPPGLKE